jgi:hypothetical protein
MEMWMPPAILLRSRNSAKVIAFLDIRIPKLTANLIQMGIDAVEILVGKAEDNPAAPTTILVPVVDHIDYFTISDSVNLGASRNIEINAEMDRGSRFEVTPFPQIGAILKVASVAVISTWRSIPVRIPPRHLLDPILAIDRIE